MMYMYVEPYILKMSTQRRFIPVIRNLEPIKKIYMYNISHSILIWCKTQKISSVIQIVLGTSLML